VQGIALVTFPAASTILTDPAEYDLSSTQYAGLFVPQVITAIAASLLGGSLSGRFGTKRVYLAGLVAGLVSMTLLIVSQFFTSDQSLAYGLLLLATAFLGCGFGLTVPALNTFAAAFHPAAADRAILVPQRPARTWNRPGPRVRGDLPRDRLLAGHASRLDGPLRRPPARQRASAAARRAGSRPLRARRPEGSLRVSGSTRASHSSTASARRSTATGLSST
jgi:hypothetical protein